MNAIIKVGILCYDFMIIQCIIYSINVELCRQQTKWYTQTTYYYLVVPLVKKGYLKKNHLNTCTTIVYNKDYVIKTFFLFRLY